MKQYGPNFFKSEFRCIANKTASIARHVAIKNNILNISRISCVSDAQVQQCVSMHTHPGTSTILDIVHV